MKPHTRLKGGKWGVSFGPVPSSLHIWDVNHLTAIGWCKMRNWVEERN